MVKEDVQPQLHNRLGVAIAMRTYKAHCDLLASERWQLLAAAGARTLTRLNLLSDDSMAHLKDALRTSAGT